MEAAARDLEGFKRLLSAATLEQQRLTAEGLVANWQTNAPTEGFKGLKAGKRQA